MLLRPTLYKPIQHGCGGSYRLTPSLFDLLRAQRSCSGLTFHWKTAWDRSVCKKKKGKLPSQNKTLSSCQMCKTLCRPERHNSSIPPNRFPVLSASLKLFFISFFSFFSPPVGWVKGETSEPGRWDILGQRYQNNLQGPQSLRAASCLTFSLPKHPLPHVHPP